MIYLGSSKDMNNDMKNWMIVRSVGWFKHNPASRYNYEHISDLAPSGPLFSNYWKNKNIYNEQWFKENYVGRFITEMIQSNPDPENKGPFVSAGTKYEKSPTDFLNDLYNRSKREDIRLVCACTDESTCHRSIVGGLLLGVGANVVCNDSYAKYFDMYKQIKSAIPNADTIRMIVSNWDDPKIKGYRDTIQGIVDDNWNGHSKAITGFPRSEKEDRNMPNVTEYISNTQNFVSISL